VSDNARDFLLFAVVVAAGVLIAIVIIAALPAH
jgi:hypothetical protein